MKKLIVILMTILICLPIFGQAGNGPSGKQAGLKKVTILCMTSPETNALKAAAEEFMKKKSRFPNHFL